MRSTITSKGQVTLPKNLRDHLQLREGDRLEFLVLENGRVEMRPVTAPVTRLKGMVPPPARAATLEEMEEAIRKRGRGA